MDLRRFAVRITGIGKGVEVNAGKMVRRVTLAVDGSVVIATPVDTGRARSNWIAEIGGPAQGVRSAYVEGKEGSTAGPNAQRAIEQARAVVAQYKTGDTVHITNNLPYIGRLNDGWSAQAPAGFVQTSVLQGIEQVQSTRLID